MCRSGYGITDAQLVRVCLLSLHRSPALPVSMHLTEVMHQTIEQPLRVHLLLASQAEAPQSVSATDVGEHRLRGPESSAVLITALLGVDLALHPRTVGLRFPFRAPEEAHDLAGDGVLGILQTSTPKGAGPTVALRPPGTSLRDSH